MYSVVVPESAFNKLNDPEMLRQLRTHVRAFSCPMRILLLTLDRPGQDLLVVRCQLRCARLPHRKSRSWYSHGSCPAHLVLMQKEPGTGAKLFSLFIYVARFDQDTTPGPATKDQLLQWLTSCDPRCAHVLLACCVHSQNAL